MKNTCAIRLCRCIKHVRKTIKVRRGTKESAAIGTCVKSVLQRRGRTLKKFRCGKKPHLITQKPLHQKLLRGGACPCSAAPSSGNMLGIF